MNSFWAGLKNKKNLFFVFLAIFNLNIFFVSGDYYAYAVVKDYVYTEEDCKQAGLEFDKEGIGTRPGIGCVFYSASGAIINRKKQIDATVIGQSSNLYSKMDAYTTNDSGKEPTSCLSGYKKGRYDFGNAKDVPACIKDKSFRGTPGLPSGVNDADIYDEKSCKDDGGSWFYTNNNHHSGSMCGFGKKLRDDGFTEEWNYAMVKKQRPDEFFASSERCPNGYTKFVKTEGGNQRNACRKSSNGTNLDCTKPENKEKKECKDAEKDFGSGDDSGSSEDKSSCKIDGVGWIVCPGANFLSKVVMDSYKLIADNLLQVRSNELFTNSGQDKSSGKSLTEVWGNFRDIANVLFVILFTIVIISQITSLGISNYGIKKMLPRLLIFAILINISYYISVIAVDASNILGRSIFNTIIGSVEWSGASGDSSLSTIVAGGLALGTGAILFGGTMLLALISAAIGMAVMIITLMIRQAAVIILVVLSPIAFASAILPNTEGIFNKWKSIFKSMLVIYPMASIVVSLSVLASNTLAATANGNHLIQGLYLTLPFVGMAGVVALIRGALAALDKLTNANITGKLSSLAGGANKFMGNTSMAKHATNWSRGNVGALTGRDKNPNTKIGRFLGRAGRMTGVAAVAGGLRNSRLRADSNAQIIEENQKWDDEDRRIAMLEQMEASGTITDSQLRSLNGLRAIKQKREDDQITAQSVAMARSWATLNGDAAKDAAIENSLVGAMQSGDFSKFRVAYGAAKNSGKKESDIANIMSSAIKSSGVSQEFAQKFTDRYAGDMKAVSPSLMGAMTVARNTQGGITTQKLSNGLTMAESVMGQAMSDPGAYANMTAKSLTALRPGETTNYLNAIDNMSQDQLSSAISMANNALTNPETRDDMTADQEKFLNQIIQKANSKIVANPNSNTNSSQKANPPSNPVPNNNSPTRKVQPNYRGNWINPDSGKKPNNP
ncbi:MAG: hypothetical protein Q4A23_01680 [bacterium]|nr:hypothetical protein [bacterium]